MKRIFFLTSVLFTFFLVSCDDGDIEKNNNNQNNNNQNPVCGNGILETGETCDGTALSGATCENINQGFTGGTLACANDCTLDTSGCTTACQDACEVDNRVCDNNTLRVCETNAETGCTAWVDTDCTATSQTCQIIGGVAQCAACVDACTLNDERCNAANNGIESCLLGALGCTEWRNAACPQATPACELQGGVPTCVASCVDACTLNAKRCNAANDGIETCITGASGCTEWSNTACDAATPTCVVDNGTAQCVMINGSGDSCSDVYVITVPFYTEGTDFTADFPTNDMTFTDASCDLGYNGNGVDAVFAVQLAQDEAIIFAQGGGLDGMLYIQGVCDAAGTCYDAIDDEASNQTEAILFQAPAAGTYYLIVKAYSANPYTRSYAIAVWAYEDPVELSCGDGFDNDLDDNVDCADPDCFGVGHCTTETVCGDGQDNDADGNVDCDDVDCSAAIACQSGQSCTDPQVITTFPFNVTGTDITADFTNAQTFTGPGCDTANGVEAVFAVSLTAGQRIKIDETGTLDAVIRVVQPCDNATTCLLSKDSPETNLIFTAPSTGIYYVILEAWSSSPSTKGYNFSIINWDVTETNCTDTTDDDLDGLIDCNDPDCFGLTGCTTELNCSDGFDNDADGNIDCNDLDCAAASACELGESCNNPLVVTTFPFNVTGTNFSADYTNEHTFTGTGCTVTGGSEAIFAVDLLAGERLRLNEPGALDAMLRVIAPCANTTACLVNSDSESNILFTAPADGRYFVVLESYYSTSTSAYNFTIEKFPGTETNCTDAVDNDGDGAIDCADSDCLGNPACPALIWQEGFESGLPAGWNILGTVWEVGTVTGTYTNGPARCYAGSNCAATNLNGAYIFDMAWDSHCLETGDIDLTGRTAPRLMFQGWMHGEGATYDGGRVQVYTGGAWTDVNTLVTPAYNATVDSQSAWVYTDKVWRSYSINLTSFAGSTIKVRFCWRSDDYVQNAGWYIDEVMLLD